MNEQDKIKLGKFLLHEVCGFKFPTPPSDLFYIRHSDLILNKIQEITQNTENTPPKADLSKLSITELIELSDYQISAGKRHICVVCGHTFSTAEMPINFSICGACDSKGLEPNSCIDKNGVEFFPGSYLKNEASSATVQILKISDTQIFDDKNVATDREDFVKAGWIVHERVTTYKMSHGLCVTNCKFKEIYGEGPHFIGGPYCRLNCKSLILHDVEQKWVICELYQQEMDKCT